MAKALELYIDNKLSPLQQAALRRINEYREELAQKGLYVRSAIELELFTQDSRGWRAAGMLKLDKVEEHLRKTLPHHIEHFKYETMTAMPQADTSGRYTGRLSPTQDPADPAHYELNVIDPADFLKHSHKEYDPGSVAAACSLARDVSLPSALRNQSCLRTQGEILIPNFKARPFERGDDTSALHVNMSLYDKDGKNLFAGPSSLRSRSAHALSGIQRDAAIAMLPSDNSLARIGANKHAPGGIGISALKNPASGYASVLVRDRAGAEPDQRNESRIENRLPGADADPFVATALTMAALVKVVRGQDNPMDAFEDPQHDIPRSREALAKTFQKAKELRELLGKDFYTALDREYCTSPARS